MKKSIIRPFLILALLTVISFASYSQTKDSNIAATPQSTPAAEQTVTAEGTISFLLTQNENAREVIKRQDKRIADLEAEIVAEQENSGSIQKSYDAAKSEIASLKQSNEALSRAVAINEDTISKLQTDNAKQKEKASKATKEKWRAYAAIGGILILKIFVF